MTPPCYTRMPPPTQGRRSRTILPATVPVNRRGHDAAAGRHAGQNGRRASRYRRSNGRVSSADYRRVVTDKKNRPNWAHTGRRLVSHAAMRAKGDDMPAGFATSYHAPRLRQMDALAAAATNRRPPAPALTSRPRATDDSIAINRSARPFLHGFIDNMLREYERRCAARQKNVERRMPGTCRRHASPEMGAGMADDTMMASAAFRHGACGTCTLGTRPLYARMARHAHAALPADALMIDNTMTLSRHATLRRPSCAASRETLMPPLATYHQHFTRLIIIRARHAALAAGRSISCQSATAHFRMMRVAADAGLCVWCAMMRYRWPA